MTSFQVSRYIIVTFSQTASSSQSFCTLIPWDHGSIPQPSLVMLINTLNWPSIKTRSIPWLTLKQHSLDISVKSRLILIDCRSTLSQLSTDCWSDKFDCVDRRLTKYQSGCPSSIVWDVNQGYQLRESIAAWKQMRLVYVIQAVYTSRCN